MSALQYMGIMDKVNKNMRTFIGVMLNTARGAVGANSNLRGTINDAIARDFAYLLFDDFNTIGRDMTHGVNGIHIFNLNGVMIPLSFLLNIYGQPHLNLNGLREACLKLSLRFHLKSHPHYRLGQNHVHA